MPQGLPPGKLLVLSPGDTKVGMGYLYLLLTLLGMVTIALHGVPTTRVPARGNTLQVAPPR